MKYLLFLFLLNSTVSFSNRDCKEISLLTTENSNINFSNSLEPIGKTRFTKTIGGLLGAQILFDTNFDDTESDHKLTISGLDLTFNPNTFDFVYVAENGSITGVEYDSISMDMGTGALKVTNAKLYHFSRYGFVN